MNQNPRIRPGLRAQKLGNELMLFDEASNRVHVLNATCAVVWEALAAGCAASDIPSRLEAAFDTQGKDLAATVQSSLALLRGKGLLEESPTA